MRPSRKDLDELEFKKREAHCSLCGDYGRVGFAVIPKGLPGKYGGVLPTTSYLRPVCARCVETFPDKHKSKVQGLDS